MKEHDTTTGGLDPRFHTTLWGELLRLKDWRTPEGRELLNRLLKQYWKPIYAYVRVRWDKSNEDAKDLTQEFFASLMERDALQSVDPGRGRFRQFLKTSLEHFLIDENRSQTRQKRGGHTRRFQLDPDLPILSPGDTPEQAFDREWARNLFAWGVGVLRERMKKMKKETLFEIFRECALESGPAGPPSYTELARRHGLSETDVRNGLHQTRELFRLIIRRKIAEYVLDEDELLAELKELFDSAQ
ncbi:MAG: sigma-70 family RNA polymerase sigma factor [Planctomycetes bacterium]|nr:sigma-70 family RNA polymerase sigma factor [Planctomycetota bacterium]